VESVSQGVTIVRFGAFEMDLRSGELRKSGILVNLPPQPFKILALLVRRSGDLVTREEIQREVWGDQTVVDFESGLNFAINKIRSALGDRAETGRYVETLPRRGYRFLVPVEMVPNAPQPVVVPAAPASRLPRWLWPAGALVLVVIGVYFAAANWRAGRQVRSVAVLPFENLSRAPADDYLADGTTEALITELGRVSALPVTSRTSSERYRKTTKLLKEIARDLKVDAIVEGAVLREGDNLRISVQLIEAESDRQIWSESYERKLDDVLTVQGEIARSIARAIRVKVTAQQQADLSRPRTVNPQAYQMYVRGRFYWNKVTGDGSHRAIADFEQAIAKDPHFALAYAGLADAYAELPVSLGTLAADAYPKAKKAAEQALSIDPQLVEAVNVLAEVAAYSWQWPEAERLFQQAFRLNPSYAQASHDYGFYLIAMGRLKEATEWNQRACMLDPLSVYYASDLAMLPYMQHAYTEAIRQTQLVLAMDASYPVTYLNLALAYAANRQFDEAIEAAKKSLHLEGENPFMLSTLSYVNGRAGKKAEAYQALQQLNDMSRRRPVPTFYVGFAWLGLGEYEKAIDSFLKAYDERFYVLAFVKVLPEFEPLRTDPRFKELVRRMKLPD
jgi:TolB-like protein/DNA-binding winged helix-turn-helix (wHTH) protein/tetratricopeptide (TPR) repeat protein